MKTKRTRTTRAMDTCVSTGSAREGATMDRAVKVRTAHDWSNPAPVAREMWALGRGVLQCLLDAARVVSSAPADDLARVVRRCVAALAVVTRDYDAALRAFSGNLYRPSGAWRAIAGVEHVTDLPAWFEQLVTTHAPSWGLVVVMSCVETWECAGELMRVNRAAVMPVFLGFSLAMEGTDE